MEKSQFTWVNFYMAFADRLLEYRKKRLELLRKLKSAFGSINDMAFPKLDSSGEPTDIDPFTVFGLFNKNKITELHRKQIISALANELRVEAQQPTDFVGIPVLNNLNATFLCTLRTPRRI